jgi:Zn-dependent peptidase ImmA (M78 family)
VSTTGKGNELEDEFHEYLLDQQRQGQLVFGAHDPDRCVIHRKKKYYSRDREGDVEFDIVIELYGVGRPSPHTTIVFECKNYGKSVPEVYVREFSDKLKEIFPNAHKGVLVTSSRLQSGARKLAESRKLGIVKYDHNGLEFIIDRQGRTFVEKRLMQAQIFVDESKVKPLKFSAYHDGKFFGTVGQFTSDLLFGHKGEGGSSSRISVPFVPTEVLRAKAQAALESIDYKKGPVDLEAVCAKLALDLEYTDKIVRTPDGILILGSANFDRNLIQIHAHGNPQRERFTLAHEIGHFCLQHKQYIRNDTIIASDLMLDSVGEESFNYERLEYQANAFASFLILPDHTFRIVLDEVQRKLDIRNHSHGYVFVDDQPVNYGLYHELLVLMSTYFEASRQVIEIKLHSLGLLNDQRRRHEVMDNAQSVGSILFRE